jgi:hypothetical protein
MKRTDLEKQRGHKINNQIQKGNATGPFKDTASLIIDKREQRKLDKAKGLIPFAIKLNEDLVTQIETMAKERNVQVNDLVAELLRAGMGKG